MASFVYDKAREAFLTQNPSIDWDTDTVKVSLVTSSYVPSSSADQYESTITSYIIATATLSGKTGTLGVANASSVTFTAVAAGSTGVALVLWKDTGSAATSPLIAYLTSDLYTGLPVVTNGGDIVVTWPTDSNKIFKL